MIKQMADMVDGEFGVVVQIGGIPGNPHEGRIVHCYRDKIIPVGHSSGNAWTVLEGNINEVEIWSLDQLQEMFTLYQNRFGTTKELGGS